MSIDGDFKCLMVRKTSGKNVARSLETITASDLPQGDVTVKLLYSSLNYKDALGATGHPGVAMQLPHIPGIDGGGIVVESKDPYFKTGDEVLVFHAKFGTAAFGAYSEYVRVPADWVYPLPAKLRLRTAMIYGTAGFTAAQSIDQLERHGVTPDRGDVLVTGATGGVGTFAVKMLAKLGYQVVAVTGKTDRADWLKANGAREVVARHEMNDTSSRPLLSARWAGAVDTVGGNPLATVLRGTKLHGCVTACGLVAGHELSLTVYPFILRGVTLQGVDSANISYAERTRIWNRLADEFAVDGLDDMTTETNLKGLGPFIDNILNGQVAGRVIVSF